MLGAALSALSLFGMALGTGDQDVDALPGGELVFFMLLGDRFFAAHLKGFGFTCFKFFDFIFDNTHYSYPFIGMLEQPTLP